MPKNRFAGFTAAITILLMTMSLLAQAAEPAQKVSEKEEIALLEQKSREAYEAGQWVPFYVANMKLSQLRPYEPDYIVNVIRACALLDRKSTAYHYMLKMQQQGLAYDFNSTDDTLLIRDTEAYEHINGMLIEAGKPAGVGSAAFSLPGNPAHFQAITWDESRNRFLVGTMDKGSVLAVDADGESEVLIEANNENGLMSISGLAVDVDRNRLWVSSAATPVFNNFSPADKDHGSLFELNLETLEQVGRYNLPVDGLHHEPGSLAVTDDGLVYLIDRATPIIYRKTPDSTRLEPFFGSAELRALRDISVAPDNSRIFVSDAVKGVLAIDPVGTQAALMGGPENMNFGGIEGIEYRNGDLFLVQGGFAPQRVIRLALDANGAAVESVSPMAIALDEFSHPGLATIQGDSLYYFANSGANDAPGAIVMTTPLDAGVQVAPPDMSAFEEAYRASQKQKEE